MSQCIQTHLRRQMVGLRCGCHPLNVHRMKFQVPREARTSKVYATDGAVDDIMHFMLHCEHYAPTRSKHTNNFNPHIQQEEMMLKCHIWS
jgi:hypothetical protein